MTNTQLRAIRWTTLLIVLTFFRAAMADNSMNSFDLRDPQSPQALTAEQAIEKANEIFRLGAQDNPARTQKESIIELIKNGDNVIRLCEIDHVYSFEQDEYCGQKLKELTNAGKLRANMNAATGKYVRLNNAPVPQVEQVKAIYPLYTQSDKEGLIFFVAVYGNGVRTAGWKDIGRDAGILKEKDDNAYTAAGAIYLIKFDFLK